MQMRVKYACMHSREMFITFAKVYAAGNLDRLAAFVSDVDDDDDEGTAVTASLSKR